MFPPPCTQETLDEWQACQRTWMYLESIFGSPDIVRQLPAAAKLFQAVDKSWRHIMVVTADEPLAIKQVTYQRIACVSALRRLMQQAFI